MTWRHGWVVLCCFLQSNPHSLFSLMKTKILMFRGDNPDLLSLLRCRKCGTGGYLLISTLSHMYDSCATDSSVPTNLPGPGNQTPPTSIMPHPLLTGNGCMLVLNILKKWVLFIGILYWFCCYFVVLDKKSVFILSNKTWKKVEG